VLKYILPLISMLALVACVPPTPPPPPIPPVPATPEASPPAAALQGAAASAPTSPEGQYWNVNRVRCSQLLGADDDDRAAATMFYYGYLAAKAGISVIDVSKIDANIHRVMEQCERAPNMTVPQAYRAAFGRRQRRTS
jgi:hypothetical protein